MGIAKEVIFVSNITDFLVLQLQVWKAGKELAFH